MLIAHVGRPPQPHDLWTSWNIDPVVAVPLVVAAWLYLRGLSRGPEAIRPSRGRMAATISAGMIVAVAVMSPIDGLGTALAGAHMVQHLLLTLAAAPLLIAGRPWQVIPWGVERGLRKRLGRNRRTWAKAAAAVANPWVAAGVYIVVLTVWHGRTPYELALASPVVHGLEHVTFLIAGLVFWAAIARGVAPRSTPDGSTILLLFAAAMHGVFLSALMTFASSAWYPSYATTAPAWGLSALADQHLAGVIMWIWGSLVYVGAVVLALARWISASEQVSGDAIAPST